MWRTMSSRRRAFTCCLNTMMSCTDVMYWRHHLVTWLLAPFVFTLAARYQTPHSSLCEPSNAIIASIYTAHRIHVVWSLWHKLKTWYVRCTCLCCSLRWGKSSQVVIWSERNHSTWIMYTTSFLCYSDKPIVASLCHCPSFSPFVFFKHSFPQKDMFPTLWLMLLWTSSRMLFCCTPQKAISFIWTKYLLCQILVPFAVSSIRCFHSIYSTWYNVSRHGKSSMPATAHEQKLVHIPKPSRSSKQASKLMCLICFIADTLVILGTHIRTHNLKDCNYCNVQTKMKGIAMAASPLLAESNVRLNLNKKKERFSTLRLYCY